jgi:hypothetical protein
MFREFSILALGYSLISNFLLHITRMIDRILVAQLL